MSWRNIAKQHTGYLAKRLIPLLLEKNEHNVWSVGFENKERVPEVG